MKTLVRALDFIKDTGLPITRFCKMVGIGKSTWYRIINEEVDISDEIEEKMDIALKKFGY